MNVQDSDSDSDSAGGGARQPGRRHDPGRRERIIDAALECIAADGVAGTSHRAVARRADVPLGSMTYHFAGMEELLVEAFTRFATRISESFDQRLAAAGDRAGAIEVLVAVVHEDRQASRSEQVVNYELYTLAARQERFRTITQGWMRASRAALEHHFDPESARRIDAHLEGAALHVALDPDPQGREQTRAALQRLAGITPSP